METISLGVVIAERVVHSSKNGVSVIVRIGLPQKTDHDDFVTPYQILGAGTDRVRFSAGMDAVQSLQLVFKVIAGDLEGRAKDLDLRWLDAPDTGFGQK
jgi:hypothetical protein